MRPQPASPTKPSSIQISARWFRVRSTGGGFVPCSWQGWLLVATMPASLIASRAIDGPGLSDLGRIAAGAGLLALYLLIISLTGGRTVWNWIVRFER